MIKIDVMNDFLELFAAKKDIEDMLLASKTIEEKFTIEDFIKYINFGTHIYWENEQTIFPFKIIKTPNNEYLFYTGTNTKKVNVLFEALDKIQYKFDVLTHKTSYDIATEELTYTPHFIINSELYYD